MWMMITFLCVSYILGIILLSGVLMGIAIRTGSPLSLNLAEPVWKQLAGMPLTPADITEVSVDFRIMFCKFYHPESGLISTR